MSQTAKQIVLTGVSRGLGLALANGLIAEGHTLIGCARSEQTVEKLNGQWGEPHRCDALDVSDDDQVARWAAEVISTIGPPDLLVNNAALINGNAPLWKVPASEFSDVVDVNIKGVVNVIRHFLPSMIQRETGIVVNLSSGWGRAVAADVAPYCATKWAIEGLTRALAEEMPPGMAAVPLNPGIVNTEMLESCFGESASSYPDATTWAKTAVPFLLQLGPQDNGQPLSVPD